MNSSLVKRVAAFIGTLILVVFIVGLAKSISDGAAGFWGGLPFWIISMFVLGLAIYNMWEDGFKNR